MQTNNVLIDADDVSVEYGSDYAIKDISFCVHAGEFIGLIGPNGAGKSTLLQVIIGAIKPTAGIITVQHSSIGYVAQNGDGYDGMVPISVLEVVGLSTQGNVALAMKALKAVNMEKLAKKKLNQLSGGQKQRVLIAKALASGANLLILDEPTTGIDQQAEADFFELITGLNKQGTAIIMVGHELETLRTKAQRIICLKQKILFDGPANQCDISLHLPKFYQQQHQNHHKEHHA